MNESRIYDEVHVDIEQVESVLAGWGLRVRSVERLDGGLINTNLKIETDQGTCLMRIYHEDRTEEEVAFELSVLTRLSEAGVRAQTPFPARQPGRIAGRLFSVLDYIDGDTLDDSCLGPGTARQAGCLLGRMQGALAGFKPAGHKVRCDVTFIDTKLRTAVTDLPSTAAEEILRAWGQAKRPFARDDLPMGVVHADVYPGNAVTVDGRLEAFIDFDDAYFGTVLFDTAIAAMEFSHRDGEIKPELLRAFLEGYESQRGPVDRGQLIDAVWLNCFRFFAYTLPLTLGAGDSWSDNAYAERIKQLSDPRYRESLVRASMVMN